jgi:hypothetical protein
MKIFRLLVLIMLSLALPTVGLASVGFMGRCPMQPAMADDGPMAMSHDHCKMSEAKVILPAKAKAGQMCKFGQDCQICSIYQSTNTFKIFHPLPVAQVVAPLAADTIFSDVPDGLWRPPRSL